jgi:hypothetical protein
MLSCRGRLCQFSRDHLPTTFAAVAEWRSSSAIALINKSKHHDEVLICWVMALPGWLNPELRTKLSIGDLPLILTEGRRGVNLGKE